jgi:hypothetical protein
MLTVTTAVLTLTSIKTLSVPMTTSIHLLNPNGLTLTLGGRTRFGIGRST